MVLKEVEESHEAHNFMAQGLTVCSYRTLFLKIHSVGLDSVSRRSKAIEKRKRVAGREQATVQS